MSHARTVLITCINLQNHYKSPMRFVLLPMVFYAQRDSETCPKSHTWEAGASARALNWGVPGVTSVFMRLLLHTNHQPQPTGKRSTCLQMTTELSHGHVYSAASQVVGQFVPSLANRHREGKPLVNLASLGWHRLCCCVPLEMHIAETFFSHQSLVCFGLAHF